MKESTIIIYFLIAVLVTAAYLLNNHRKWSKIEKPFTEPKKFYRFWVNGYYTIEELEEQIKQFKKKLKSL